MNSHNLGKYLNYVDAIVEQKNPNAAKSDWLQDRFSGELNSLPDSDFAFVMPGGQKDWSGKTVPRNLRKLPIHDKAHTREALVRLPQMRLPPQLKARVLNNVLRAARKFGLKGIQPPKKPLTMEWNDFLDEEFDLG